MTKPTPRQGLSGISQFFRDLLVALVDVGLEFVDPVFHLLGNGQRFNTAGGGTAKRGEQGFGADVELLEHVIDQRHDGGMLVRVADKHLRQRTGFHGDAVVTGSLEPGIAILVAHLGEGRVWFPLRKACGPDRLRTSCDAHARQSCSGPWAARHRACD